MSEDQSDPAVQRASLRPRVVRPRLTPQLAAVAFLALCFSSWLVSVREGEIGDTIFAMVLAGLASFFLWCLRRSRVEVADGHLRRHSFWGRVQEIELDQIRAVTFESLHQDRALIVRTVDGPATRPRRAGGPERYVGELRFTTVVYRARSLVALLAPEIAARPWVLVDRWVSKRLSELD